MAAVSERYELSAILMGRYKFYRFLHTLFRGPLQRLDFEFLRLNSDIDGLQELGGGGAHLYNFFNTAGETELSVETREYTRLFIGPGAIPVPPWESYFTSLEKLLFDTAMYEVRRKYHESGFKSAKENIEPDDHLSIELEFMILLSGKSMEIQEKRVLQALLEKQLDFLESHLARWIPAFSEKLEESTDSLLYKGAALLLADFIIYDIDCLKDVLEGMLYVG